VFISFVRKNFHFFITLKRLMSEGYSEFEAKQLIGQGLAVELFDVMKKKVPFNEARYSRNLKHLPKEPSDKS